MENLVGSAKAEARTGTVVESTFHIADLVMSGVAKISSLRIVLAD